MIKPQHIDIYLQDARDTLENGFSDASILKAIEIYKAAIRDFPEASIEPYVAVAYLAVRAGLDNEAYTLLNKAKQLAPQNPQVRTLLKTLDERNGVKSVSPIRKIVSLRERKPDIF